MAQGESPLTAELNMPFLGKQAQVYGSPQSPYRVAFEDPAEVFDRGAMHVQDDLTRADWDVRTLLTTIRGLENLGPGFEAFTLASQSDFDEIMSYIAPTGVLHRTNDPQQRYESGVVSYTVETRGPSYELREGTWKEYEASRPRIDYVDGQMVESGDHTAFRNVVWHHDDADGTRLVIQQFGFAKHVRITGTMPAPDKDQPVTAVAQPIMDTRGEEDMDWRPDPTFMFRPNGTPTTHYIEDTGIKPSRGTVTTLRDAPLPTRKIASDPLGYAGTDGLDAPELLQQLGGAENPYETATSMAISGDYTNLVGLNFSDLEDIKYLQGYGEQPCAAPTQEPTTTPPAPSTETPAPDDETHTTPAVPDGETRTTPPAATAEAGDSQATSRGAVTGDVIAQRSLWIAGVGVALLVVAGAAALVLARRKD